VQTRLAAESGTPNYEGGTQVKLRSRVAAVAAATGLAAGLLIIGGGGTAHAQDTVLISCSNVGGTATIKPSLSDGALNTSISVKGPLRGTGEAATQFKPVANTVDCTGLLATPGDGGTPDDVGLLTKVSAKLVGSATCNLIADPPITDPLDPLDGKFSLTFTTLDLNLKPWASSTYVRIGQGDNPAAPDELAIKNGIVTKGAGVGADVTGGFIFSPYDSKTKNGTGPDPDGEGPLEPPLLDPPQIQPDQASLSTTGQLQFGAGSLVIGGRCIEGTQDIATAFWATDGTNLIGLPYDGGINIVLPGDAP
jgi:hypothetical protein